MPLSKSVKVSLFAFSIFSYVACQNKNDGPSWESPAPESSPAPSKSGEVNGDTNESPATPNANNGEQTDLPKAEENPSAPIILSLSANGREVTIGSTVKITALVSDPDGIDDLIGGKLVHVDSNGNETDFTYAAFTTDSAEGAYQINLTAEEIRLAAPIVENQDRRTFRAVFFDAAGNQAKQDISIKFVCGTNLLLCGNRCVQHLTDPENCGQCRTTFKKPSTMPELSIFPRCEEGVFLARAGYSSNKPGFPSSDPSVINRNLSMIKRADDSVGPSELCAAIGAVPLKSENFGIYRYTRGAGSGPWGYDSFFRRETDTTPTFFPTDEGMSYLATFITDCKPK